MGQVACISNDEGMISWDIGFILENIDDEKFPVYEYSVEELSNRSEFGVNTEYAMKTTNDKPIIILKLNEDKEELVDGFHRLYRAKQLGITTIKCYILPIEFHKKYIKDYDEEIYNKVVSKF